MGHVASVVINNCNRSFDKEYHYLIPTNMAGIVKPGIRVIVPFGRGDKSREGYVLDILESTYFDELKEIRKVLDDQPIINSDMIKLAKWMKRRYICTYSAAIRCMLPAGINVKSIKIVKLISQEDYSTIDGGKEIIDILSNSGGWCEYSELRSQSNISPFSRTLKRLQEIGAIEITEEYKPQVKEKYAKAAFLVSTEEEISDLIENDRIKSIQQIKALEILMEQEYVLVQELQHFAGISASVLNTLFKKGFIDFREVEVERSPFSDVYIEESEALELMDEQQVALDKFVGYAQIERFKEVLLHGITGSGKTEVYMQFIDYLVSKGKTAIVLVPEISLTPQMVHQFRSRFGENVAVLHSRLSLGERYDQWRLIKNDKIKVVVGARSAVFAPLKNIGTIIIDEEHEPSYKSEVSPKYDARDVARARCMENKAVLLLGSATPSVETYYRTQIGKVDILKMIKRPNGIDLPHMEIIDMREELSQGNRSIFSRKLENAIKENVETGHQTILFLNRRGHANFVLCRNCGIVLKCPNCNISLTYHSYNDRVICHYCGYTLKVPTECPACNSTYIRFFGLGTQRVEDEIKKQYENISLIRMDTDTTTRKNAHEKILNAFREDNVNVLLGTQMIAKGHDFPNVTLIGVLAADIMLNVDDYRASERTFQLITQVAGRAGRGASEGKVLVQTYNTDDYSIIAACNYEYDTFYKQEVIVRKNLNYPPFTNIGCILVKGLDDALAQQKIVGIYKNINSLMESKNELECNIIAPMRAPISKINGRHRWRIIIKDKNYLRLVSLLTKVSDDFVTGRGKNRVDLSVDVNPINML